MYLVAEPDVYMSAGTFSTKAEANEAWQEKLARMPGYEPSHTVEVLAMNRVLSWWDFPEKKTPRVK